MMIRLMPVVFRIGNVPMRLILSLPTATPLGKRVMLVYLTGRKSGRHYRARASSRPRALQIIEEVPKTDGTGHTAH
jgi:hypothetical protein